MTETNSSALSKQINALRSEVRYHDYLYYIVFDPSISDYEYDQMYRQLQDLEAEHPELITPDSPTQCTGEKSGMLW